MYSNSFRWIQKVVRFIKGQEYEALLTLNPNIVNFVHEKEVKLTEGLKTANKAQLCIDHIQRKTERINLDQKRDNNRIVTLLRELATELKQYL